MKPFDPLWLSDHKTTGEEPAHRFFARDATVMEDGSTTCVRCTPTRFGSTFAAAVVLFVMLNFVLSVIGLANPWWAFLASGGVVSVAVVLSARESVTVTASEIRIRQGLRPFRKTVRIPIGSVETVRVEAFIDSPWDLHVAIVTGERTFRIAASTSEAAAQEVAQALRRRIPAAREPLHKSDG